jgi:hypothetical protein
MSNWIERLEEAKDIINAVYSEIHVTGVNDSDIDHLASLGCEIDEATRKES